MKSNCNKCEWHHLREGYSYCWRTGEEKHHIMIDVCIHPILDDLKKTDSKGNKQYHVEKCEVRNVNQICQYFQPKRSFFKHLIDIFRGKKILDIYERYNNIKTESAYEL
jgi:hypothetical protein